MTAAVAPDGASVQAPPESAWVAVYPMRTQRSPLRVTYAVAPDVLACAALTDALACTAAEGVAMALLADAGAGLAVLPLVPDDGGETAAAALAHVAPPLALVLE